MTRGRMTCVTSFASLLLHEGRSVMYAARQLGHDALLPLGSYGHVIDELDDAPQIPAEDATRAEPPAAARVSPVCPGGNACIAPARAERPKRPPQRGLPRG